MVVLKAAMKVMAIGAAALLTACAHVDGAPEAPQARKALPQAETPAAAFTASPADAPGAAAILVMLREATRPHFRPDEAYGGTYATDQDTPALRARIGEVNRDHGLRQLDQWPMPTLQVRCYLEAVPPDQDMAALLARLNQDGRVAWAQALAEYRTLGHADRYEGLQSNVKALELDTLHTMATGRGVSLAVIDTGVDARHPDLASQLTEQRDFTGQAPTVAELHGTQVAGLMAAAHNEAGIVGVAPDAGVMALRACWQTEATSPEARCTSFTLAKAVQHALVRGARVLNMSLTGPADPLLARLLAEALRRDVVVVAALDGADPAGGFPASLPGVIAVGCCDEGGAPSRGPVAHAGAVRLPATRVLTTMPGGSWGFVTGSSFAAAQFTGFVALALEVAPGLSPGQLTDGLARHRVAAPASDKPSVDLVELLRGLRARRWAGAASAEGVVH